MEKQLHDLLKRRQVKLADAGLLSRCAEIAQSRGMSAEEWYKRYTTFSVMKELDSVAVSASVLDSFRDWLAQKSTKGSATKVRTSAGLPGSLQLAMPCTLCKLIDCGRQHHHGAAAAAPEGIGAQLAISLRASAQASGASAVLHLMRYPFQRFSVDGRCSQRKCLLLPMDRNLPTIATPLLKALTRMGLTAQPTSLHSPQHCVCDRM